MAYGPPPEVFDPLNGEFDFTLDPCAVAATARCDRFFTPEDDGLVQSWAGERVFVNPPYGREIGKWVQKASRARRNGALVVMLLPARTDTRYFHDYIYGKAEIRFLRGRVRFLQDGKRSPSGAPFPSMVVVFRPKDVFHWARTLMNPYKNI